MENIIEELNKEGLFTINKENISNYLSVDNIDLSKEFDLISPTLANKSVTVNKDGDVYVGNDKVTAKMSKKGSLYYTIKGKYVSGRILNKAINTAIYKTSEPIEAIEMGAFELVKAKTRKGGTPWFLVKGKECYGIKTDEGAKATLQRFYYSKMAEEVELIPTKVFEPAEETIYDDSVEDFQNRSSELEEALQVVLSMRSRVLLPEEREVLKELLSEINALI